MTPGTMSGVIHAIGLGGAGRQHLTNYENNVMAMDIHAEAKYNEQEQPLVAVKAVFVQWRR